MEKLFSKSDTAVITGGASGIGLSLATRCVRLGMRVLIADRDTKLLDRAKLSLGDNCSTIEVDVASPEDWARLRENVAAELKGRQIQLRVSVCKMVTPL